MATYLSPVWLMTSKIFFVYSIQNFSTNCGLVMPCGDIDLGQHWFRQWLDAWRHHAITRTNIDLSLIRFCSIHLHSVSKVIFSKLNLKIIPLKLLLYLPGVHENSFNFPWPYLPSPYDSMAVPEAFHMLWLYNGWNVPGIWRQLIP